jgi:hypothetical protein
MTLEVASGAARAEEAERVVDAAGEEISRLYAALAEAGRRALHSIDP